MGLTSLSLTVACGRRTPLNVLLVTLDTTRADHIGSYGYKLARTPTLDRLASEGVRCSNAIAEAPITLPSHCSIMTGLLPPAHGVRDNGDYALGDGAVTLAERLHAAGYRTHAVISALVLNRRYNLTQGFDSYDDDLWAEDQPKLFMIRKRPGPRTAKRAIAWLERWSRETPRRPFFMWTHFFDAHQPYEVSAADRLLAPSTYDAAITVEDRSLGQIIDELERLGVLDNTLVVVTADHGESLGEHGEKTHAVFIYDATVHVPLEWRCPRLFTAGKVYDGPVRSIDIVPTILAALGLPGGNETQGANLLAPLAGDASPPDLPQYSESLLSEVGFGMAPLFGLREDGYKWIRAPKPELYDLRTDPHELHNLYAQERRRAGKMDRDLTAVLEDSRRHAVAARESPMDKETLENLQALGYIAPRGEREAMGGIDPKDGIAIYEQLDDARHEAQQNHWPQAEALLRHVLEVTPRNVSAVNILALARLRQGDPEGARREYLRSLELEPQQARVYTQLGAMDLLQGNLDGAKHEFEEALEISPGFVEAMSNLGMIAMLRGDTATAEKWYGKVSETDPGYPRGWRRLADLQYERGDFKQALADYRKMLATVPNDFPAIIQAANCARRIGDHAEARRLLDEAARLRDDSWIPRYNLACLENVEGHPDKALIDLRAATSRGFHNVGLLERDPDLESLRSDPTFATLLAEARRAQRTMSNEADDEGAELTRSHRQSK